MLPYCAHIAINGTCAFANCPLMLQDPDVVTGESNDEREPRDDDDQSDPDHDDDSHGDHDDSTDDDHEPQNDAVNQEQGTSSKSFGCGTGPAHKKQVGDAAVMMAFEQRDMAAVDELLRSGDEEEGADPPIVNIHVVPTKAKSPLLVLRQGSLTAEGVVSPHTDFLCDPTCRPEILPWESLTIEQKLDENDFRTKLNLWCFLPKIIYDPLPLTQEGKNGEMSREHREILTHDSGVRIDDDDDGSTNFINNGAELILDFVLQFLADPGVPSVATPSTTTSSPKRRPVARRSGWRGDQTTGEEARPLAPRDISSDPFNPNNIIDGPRLRRIRPPHHSSHHVTLAVDNGTNVAGDDPKTRSDNWGYVEDGSACLLIHTLHLPEKQKRLHPDVAAARSKEVHGLYDMKCLAWATRDQAKEHGVTPIHTGFVDAVKQNESTGERVYKSRLVMFGNRMNAYEHYSPYETSTPVAHHFALLLLRAVMVALNAFIKQIDFSQAYTHVDIEDIVYAVPPEDFRKPGDQFAIWRVFKALYGSPQAGRRWHDYIAWFLRSCGYSQSTIDPRVFFLPSYGGSFPPAFTQLATALPWLKALKKRLEAGKFRFKDMNDVRESKITVKYVQSHDNLADIFTKALPTPQFRYLADQFTVLLRNYLGDDEDSMPMLDDHAPAMMKQKKD
eukprot:g41020.t1